MAKRKQVEPEQQAGAPEWMVTFSDCMTLLLTFFVLLLSFSSFDNKDDFMRMSSSFAEQISFAPPDRSDDESVIFIQQQMPVYDVPNGSEKPTLDDEHNDQSKKTTEPSDFLTHKTFLMPSKRAFLGNTAVLSGNGRKALSDLSDYLKEFPDHVFIVSESEAHMSGEPDDSSFQRGWAVIKYFTLQHGMDHNQFSLSIAGVINQDRDDKSQQDSQRTLEIVMLKKED